MADQITTSLAEAKILVMEGMKGEDGKSPRVSASGTWEVWDGEKWVDTGIAAGVNPDDLAQAVEDYLDEHPVETDIDFMTAADIDALWGSIDGLPDGDEVSY